MKLRIIDRILIALSGLILLALGAWITLDAMGIVTPMSEVLAMLLNVQSVAGALVVAAVSVALALLGVYDVCMLFRRGRGKRGFISQKSENGEIAISVKSIESLVTKCAQKHGEIQVQSVTVDEARDGLIIRLRATLASGMNIPLAVGTLQKQIKQYITACSGVDVREVRVKVDSTEQAAEDSVYAVTEEPAAIPVETPQPDPVPAEAAVPVEVPAEEPVQDESDERMIHQRIFSMPEEPAFVPEPPVVPEPEEPEEQEAEWEAEAAESEVHEADWETAAAEAEEHENEWEAVAAEVEEQEAEWDADAAQDAEPEAVEPEEPADSLEEEKEPTEE